MRDCQKHFAEIEKNKNSNFTVVHNPPDIFRESKESSLCAEPEQKPDCLRSRMLLSATNILICLWMIFSRISENSKRRATGLVSDGDNSVRIFNEG